MSSEITIDSRQNKISVYDNNNNVVILRESDLLTDKKTTMPQQKISADETEMIKRSGLVSEHVSILKQVAADTGYIIAFRPVEPIATQLIAAGYPTKHFKIKGKSSDWGPMAGFIPVDQLFSKLEKERKAKNSLKGRLKNKKNNILDMANEEVQKCLSEQHAYSDQLKISSERLNFLIAQGLLTRQGDILEARGPSGHLYQFSMQSDNNNLWLINHKNHEIHKNNPVMVICNAKKQPFTADYDLMLLAPPMADYGHLDRLQNPDVSHRVFVRRMDTYKKVPRQLQELYQSSTAFSASEDKNMGNVNPRVHSLVSQINQALKREEGKEVVHHSMDAANSVTKPAANYPVTLFLPRAFPGISGTMVLVSNKEELVNIVTLAKQEGFYVPLNPLWEKEVRSVLRPGYINARALLERKILRDTVDRLYEGKIAFHKLQPQEQQLIFRFMDKNQLNAVLQRSKYGGKLRDAVSVLASPPENFSQGIITNDRTALLNVLDKKRAFWLELGKKSDLPNADSDSENLKAGEIVYRTMQQQHPLVDLPGHSSTLKALGLRARVLHGLQAYVGRASQGILPLAAAAALCRIAAINEQLASNTLSNIEKSELIGERSVALTELGVDLSSEVIGLIQGKLNIEIAQPATGTVSKLTLPQSASMKTGTRVTQGIRAFGPHIAGTILSAAGTGIAWYGLYRAAHELQALSASEKDIHDLTLKTQLQQKITQLSVNLGVNFMTTLISTGLALGNAIAVTAGIVSNIAAGSTVIAAVVKASATFMSIAGPVGGAILVAAFVGLWIYNGIKTVQEFSQYMELSGWDKFELGFGSIFGHVPPSLGVEMDFQKLKLSVEKAVELEIRGAFDRFPEVKTVYKFIPEMVTGEIFRYTTQTTTWFDGSEWPSTQYHSTTIPPRVYHHDVDINMNSRQYHAQSLKEGRVTLELSDFISVRKTREQRNTLYPHSRLLNLKDRLIALPDSDFEKQMSSADLSEALADSIPAELQSILAQSDARLFATSEAGQLTLLGIHEQGKKISCFKYRKTAQGHYESTHLTQALPEGFYQDNPTLFFHDLNRDGLADLIAVSENASLQVMMQKRSGDFVTTQEFSIYRAKLAEGRQESLSFARHKILGFGGTARILYSQDDTGVLYACTVISREENDANISWVNLNIGEGPSSGGAVNFIASSASDAGTFMFHLGGGKEKKVTGGVNNDSFFLLDEKTSCLLAGNEGTDTLDFSQLNLEDAHSVIINAREGKASLMLKNGNTQERVVFSAMENFTGTAGNDEITGDDNDNVINGISGKDILSAGAGNDRLAGISGTFNGGAGTDHYQLRRIAQGHRTALSLIEDYSKGEDSYVNLDYRIDDIRSIVPQAEGHLLITLMDGMEYHIHDFYSNKHASRDSRASIWHFTTQDGFSFSLETAAKLPDNMDSPDNIPAYFQSTLTREEQTQVKRDLYAGSADSGDRITLSEKIAGKQVESEIRLPPMFRLELRAIANQSTITGSERAEYLYGTAGITMKGNGGADTYIVKDTTEGVIRINNQDDAPVAQQDILILPWAMAKTKLSIKDRDAVLKCTHENGSHTEVLLMNFMDTEQARHLTVRDLFGQTAELYVTGGTLYLASRALILDKEDSLEVFSASNSGLTLDGRSRKLSGNHQRSSVIIDYSDTNNALAGTKDARNYLQVFGGRNSLYGGHLEDELHGGLLWDYMAGGKGDDIYYVQGSATIEDTEGEDTLVLPDLPGSIRETLQLEKTQDGSLSIRFKKGDNRIITLLGYYEKPGQKIEHIVVGDMRLSSEDIESLIVSPAREMTGSESADSLLGGAGSRMKGNGAADTYFIEDDWKGGIVEIDNHDVSALPARDTLILPWALSETALFVEGTDVMLRNALQPDRHVGVRLSRFMSHAESRHLAIQDSSGQLGQLYVTASTVYLASGPLTLNQEARLEVFSSSQGNLILNGNTGGLAEGNNPSAVIIDRSHMGNILEGKRNAGNHLQVSGGRNFLYGGHLNDVLYGGSGSDFMDGSQGNDTYYVSSSALIKDAAGENTLILTAAGTAEEELWLEKTQEGSLLIRLRSERARTVTVQGYYDNPGQKIEHIIIGDKRLSGRNIDNLASAMVSMPLFADLAAMKKNSAMIDALDGWSSLIAP